jgi:flavin reductase ActVB
MTTAPVGGCFLRPPADRAEQIMVSPTLSLIADATPDLVPADVFADAMSVLASGVVVVTCRLDGRPWGVTVTACASVSAQPPTVLVSLASGSPAARAIDSTRRFGVSILADRHLAVARHASAPGKAKFLEPFVEHAEAAAPAIAGALAHLDCELANVVQVADHTLYIGHVLAARATRTGAPLLYHRRHYATLAHEVADRSERCLAS